MRLCCVFVCLILSVCALGVAAGEASAQAPRLPARARVELLEQHLRVIHDEARRGRLIGGGSMLLLGGGMLGGSLYHRSLPDEDTTTGGEALAVVGLVTGGVFLGSGLLILALPGDEETLPRRWWEGVEGGGDLDIQAQQGEAVLRGLADDGRFARYLSAGVLGLFALGGLGGLSSGDAAGVSGGLLYTGLFGGLAAWTLLSPSTAEAELESYQRALGGGGSAAEPPAARLVLAPWLGPGGGGLGAAWVY